jgi:hypothetical protein
MRPKRAAPELAQERQEMSAILLSYRWDRLASRLGVSRDALMEMTLEEVRKCRR